MGLGEDARTAWRCPVNGYRREKGMRMFSVLCCSIYSLVKILELCTFIKKTVKNTSENILRTLCSWLLCEFIQSENTDFAFCKADYSSF
jgi:hypothetical protein